MIIPAVMAKKLHDAEGKLIIICDGTYLPHQKSSNNIYQKKSYSMQKTTNLSKPFIVCTTDGYIIDLFVPYFANMNDATILKEILEKTELSRILRTGDIFVLDRGFRDVVPFLEESGYEVLMPALKGQSNQLLTTESNESIFVTKIRWPVEAVHGIIAQKYKLLHHQFLNQSLPKAGLYCKIACYLVNRFSKRLTSDKEDFNEIVARMNEMKLTSTS